MRDLTMDYDLRSVPPTLLASLTLRAGLSETLAAFPPVLALTITRPSQHGTEVLFAVRDARENLTHPNVLSSPTRRLRGHDDRIAAWASSIDSVDVLDVPDWLSGEVSALLMSKVGLGADGAFRARARRAQIWQAASIIGMRGDEAVAEDLTMINVHVEIDPEMPVPSRTDSHSYQGFAPLDTHAAAYRTGDSRLLSEADGAAHQPIIYGICTASTSAMIESISASERELVGSPSR